MEIAVPGRKAHQHAARRVSQRDGEHIPQEIAAPGQDGQVRAGDDIHREVMERLRDLLEGIK